MSYEQTRDEDIIFIGEDLFHNYYVVLDYDDNKIGFSGYSTAADGPPLALPLGVIIGLAIGGLILIGVAIFCCMRYRNKKLN